jgi:tetratricopeptide (TPR) repeat protein
VQGGDEELARVRDHLPRWELREAETALIRAEGWVAHGGPADLCRRVQQMRDDLTLMGQLEQVRLKKATIVEGKFDYASADRDYAARFREQGLAAEGEDPEVVAARIQGSVIRAQLVAALDDWAVATADRDRRAWLLEVARRADPGEWSDRFRDSAVWSRPEALERLAREAPVELLTPQSLNALGAVLASGKRDPVPLLRAAQQRHPTDFWIAFSLGNALSNSKPGEAEGYYRVALAVRPDTWAVHYNLGVVLRDQGQVEEAIEHYRQAIKIDPRLAQAHTNLGVALAAKGQVEEAIEHYRQAIKIDPRLAEAHNNLGLALSAKGQVEEAIQHYREAIRVDPKHAPAHTNLGNALKAKGQVEEAIQHHRQAIKIDPKAALAYTNLGVALSAKGQRDEAIEHYRQAIQIDPRLAQAHYNLGVALSAKGQVDEAMKHFRQAIQIDPRLAQAHFHLGLALYGKGKVEEAIEHYRQAITLDSKDAQAHGALGQVLLRQGQFTQAGEATRRCLDLLPPNHRLRTFVTQQLRLCQRLHDLDDKLPAILQGKAKPADTSERLALAQLCQQHKQLYAASARFYAEAFADQPRLAQDLRAGHRYHATSAAALAASGQGKDADKPDDKERASLRRQALTWLRADLAAWTTELDKGSPQARLVVQRMLQHWQKDPALAGLRDQDALAKLPEAEREACRKLWADVDALLGRVGGSP